MASEIQVSRGSLHARDPKTLLRGELFWVPTNESNNAEAGFRKNTKYPYDGGTLYIGRPSLSEDGTYEAPMPIAGERSYKGLVYRGSITTETSTTDTIFRFVREGDFFVFDNDAVGGIFKTEYDFLKGDILLITNADYEIAPELDNTNNLNIGEAKNIQFIRINNSGGYAKYTYFEGEDMVSKNVQDAINELNHDKLEYKGRIPNDHSVAEVMTSIEDGSGKKLLEKGSLYLVTLDGIKFHGFQNGVETDWVSQKGDFVIWQDDTLQWLLIPSGYTNADEIDFNPNDAVAQQTLAATFGEDGGEHISSTQNLSNVQEALTYLLSHKAMLDSNGKVPLSQLHSTVLGAMQYMGTWDPVNDARGVTNSAYQNDWPDGRVTKEIEGDEEEAYTNNGNKAGDYYIVKTTYNNIQYYDKSTTPTADGNFSRCEELNNGDWIVYAVDPATGIGNWEIIDNSDRISSINFNINGTHASGEAEYAGETVEVSLVGNPKIAASDKLVIWQNDNTMTVAGVRLIDQAKNDPNRDAEDKYLPVYTGNTDTLMRSSIQNYFSELKGGYITQTNSNLVIGTETVSYNQYTYGNIYIMPHKDIVDSVATKENSVIYFATIKNGNVESTSYNTSSLETDIQQLDTARFILPTESSKIIGKLSGVDLISGRLTKSTLNGYIDSTSIEEHMRTTATNLDNSGRQKYSDLDVISIEFHAPVVDVNNIETRHITLGQKVNLNDDLPNGGKFENGTFLTGEVLSEIFAHRSQKSANVTNYLPQNSGVLINDTDWKKDIKGTTGTLPIYGEDDQRDNELEVRKTLIDSKISQLSCSLYESLFNTVTDLGNSTNTLNEDNNVSNTLYSNYSDIDYANELYGGTPDEKGKYHGTEQNIHFNSDTIVGEVAQGPNGSFISTPHSLLVTKSLLLGNKNTNTTHVVPGRTLFPKSSQYRFAKDEVTRPMQDIYIEMPSVSGVLLTDNSRVDGGLFIE